MYKKKRKTEEAREKEVRTVRVKVSLTPQETTSLDNRRGKFSRAAWLRMASSKSLPPVVPELNRAAWLHLSRVSGNLATIATSMRAGQYIQDQQILDHLSVFRAALLTAKGTFFSSDETEKREVSE